MKKDFLKRLTDAHSWLGLIISGLLFVVFFAGAISLFRAEITQWSIQPHFELSQGQPLPVSQVLALAIKDQPFDATEHLTLVAPEQHMPYYRVYVDIEHQAGAKDHVAFYIDPVSGEKIAELDAFYLADFIYKLHLDLNLPAGKYVIGLVSLLFLFALVSGILIHARKIVSNFFQYRSKKVGRSQLLDLHNVVGVMSLPLTLMYALTGLIFNLAIIYQIAFAVVLYQGDQQALLNDAGFQAIEPTWQDKPWQDPKIDMLTKQVTEQYGATPRVIRMHHYGDDSAVIQFIGVKEHSLTDKYDVAYRLSDNDILYTKDHANPNMLATGLYVLAKLHFGDYGGFDLRILYFILALAVCGLIVTGNLLWIEKRSRLRVQSATTLLLASKFTLWSCGGVVVATAVAFVCERALPIDLIGRNIYMMAGFVVTLLVVALLITIQPNNKYSLALLLKLTAALLVITVVLDWLMFSNKLLPMWQQGIKTVLATEVALISVAIVSCYLGHKLMTQSKVLINADVKLATI